MYRSFFRQQAFVLDKQNTVGFIGRFKAKADIAVGFVNQFGIVKVADTAIGTGLK
ncbi:hypothetical protein D3C72_2213250 [compost metagenome]